MAGTSKIEILEKVITKLVQKGITPVFDGPSIILVDEAGNKMVDFTNGLGPVGSDLTMMTKLEIGYQTVRSLVRTRISDNQTLALVSFCSHIGNENFANSGVLRLINDENYSFVPGALLRWRMGNADQGEPAEVRLDFQHRREFESELFTTPDIVKIEFNIEGKNEATWKQLTAMLRKRKQEAMGTILEGQVVGDYLEFGDLSELLNSGIVSDDRMSPDDPLPDYNPKG
jgi:hypothetical protein